MSFIGCHYTINRYKTSNPLLQLLRHPRRSKNRVSSTQVPTQEGDRRGENNSEVVLTQPDQGAKAARVQSINPWVPKLIRKPIKVTTTKKIRTKEIKITSFVFDPIYCQEAVPEAIMKKAKPVLDTSYKPFVSDDNQLDNNKPEFYRTTGGS
ncbi:hypothetical protein DSO57_1030684 [Entomophthora muscae]|uniref:Uncharacterized protein n=1 Tax=Entomophthora muscae TaxID=34485 RepID=A0ACC2RRR9_9FUNG|nr:hypothetical protein DSO57_1030684 [Entomophthora muscae]